MTVHGWYLRYQAFLRSLTNAQGNSEGGNFESVKVSQEQIQQFTRMYMAKACPVLLQLQQAEQLFAEGGKRMLAGESKVCPCVHICAKPNCECHWMSLCNVFAGSWLRLDALHLLLVPTSSICCTRKISIVLIFP